MNRVVDVLVGAATAWAVFILGVSYGRWWAHKTRVENRRLKQELRSAALDAAASYRRGYELGIDVAYEQLIEAVVTVKENP